MTTWRFASSAKTNEVAWALKHVRATSLFLAEVASLQGFFVNARGRTIWGHYWDENKKVMTKRLTSRPLSWWCLRWRVRWPVWTLMKFFPLSIWHFEVCNFEVNTALMNHRRQGWLGLLCGFIHHSTYLILQVQVGSSPHQLHHHISTTLPGCLNEGSVSILCSDRQCVGTNIHYMEQARRLWHTVGTTQRWMKGIYVHVWISQQRTPFWG